MVSYGTLKKFNPSKSNNFSVWRLSDRHYCSDRIVPVLNQNNKSFVQGPSGILDFSKVLGPGDYEDPRVLAIDKNTAAIVFVRHYENIGSMCIAVINADYEILGTIEYVCKRQTQKNWMPRLKNNALMLYARVPDVVYVVPNIKNLRLHEKIEISEIESSEWRGSSQILSLGLRGNYGIVHKRKKKEIGTYFLPGYTFAFYNFDINMCYREFDINDPSGFVYVNSFEYSDEVITLHCGLSDCKTKQYIVRDLDRLFSNGSKIVLNASALL